MSDTIRLAIGCAGFLAVGAVVGWSAGCRMMVVFLLDRAAKAGVEDDVIIQAIQILFPEEDFE